MRMNRKGDIGFMEAMAAAMTVTLVLTAFIGATAIYALETDVENRALDIDSLAGGIRIADGRIEGDLQGELQSQMDLKGIRGASVMCTSVPDSAGEPRFEGRLYFSAGTFEGTMSTERRICSVDHAGGTALVNLEVRTWA